MITEEIRARVTQGATWLDSERPGWTALIDLGTLDLTDADSCVLGQVYGHYWDAPPWDGRHPSFDFPTDQEVRDADQWCIDHGFQASLVPTEARPHAHNIDEYQTIATAWRELIDARVLAGA